MPVAISVALTVALGITPPDGSVTVPLMEPRKVCASSATASENAMRIAVTKRFIDSIPPLRSKLDRKSTRLNSSHGYISYAVFCLKKKKQKKTIAQSRTRSQVYLPASQDSTTRRRLG